MNLLPLIAVLIFVGAWWFSRSQELFYISIRKGRMLLVRGNAPAGLLASFQESLEDLEIGGSVRAVKQEKGTRLICSKGISRGTAQRLRNIFAMYPVSQLRNASALKQPTLGQIIGIAWLAWLMEGFLTRH